MFIYNITVKVNISIIDEWVKWQQEEHIPEIMGTNLFSNFTFYRLLEQDDSDGPTFIVQYHTPSRNNYEKYIQQYAATLREKAIKKWGDGFIAFRTLLQSVQ